MISDSSEVAAWRDALAADGKRVVFTNGCFDLLHAGHVRYLAAARALGDALVVGLNSDVSVRALKGDGRPLNSAADRAEVLAALRSVDRVVVFEGERATRLIEELRPQIYAKGGDYTRETLNGEERAALDAAATEIEILPLVPGKSTTATLAAMRAEERSGKIRLGVLGSGEGSNLRAIHAAIDAGELDAEVALVLSDVASAPILDLARQRGEPAVHVDPGENPRRLALPAQKEIADRLRAAAVDLVVCAGFLKVIKTPIFEAFAGRVINIHPSLLPKHKGLRAWEQALQAGDREAGCTVHFVTEEIDAGEIIAQEKVPVVDGDTAESLHARIQQAEHRLLPTVIAALVEKL